MANITTQTIRVDLSTGKVIPTAYTHQNDTARTLVFDMYNGGLPYTMTGNTVKFAYKSPVVDGQYTVIAGASMASGTVSGNKVTVTLPVAYTQISGVGMLTMIITPTSGTIRPVNIKFIVQKSADGDDEIAGASDFPATLDEIAEDWLEENISIQIDDTLSVSGKAADAKVTGDEISDLDGQIADLKSDLNYNHTAESGYVLRATNTGRGNEWAMVGTPTDAQAATAINAWLDAHPEATTTVQDGAITEVKFADSLKLKAIKDYVTPEMFGAIGDGRTNDLSAVQTAINAASTNKKPVLLNALYYINGTLTLPKKVAIYGGKKTGFIDATLSMDALSSVHGFCLKTSEYPEKNMTFFLVDPPSYSDYGTDLGILVEDVYVYSFLNYAAADVKNGTYIVDVLKVQDTNINITGITFKNVVVNGVITNGIHVYNNNTSHFINSILMFDVFMGNPEHVAFFEKADSNTSTGNHFLENIYFDNVNAQTLPGWTKGYIYSPTYRFDITLINSYVWDILNQPSGYYFKIRSAYAGNSPIINLLGNTGVYYTRISQVFNFIDTVDSYLLAIFTIIHAFVNGSETLPVYRTPLNDAFANKSSNLSEGLFIAGSHNDNGTFYQGFGITPNKLWVNSFKFAGLFFNSVGELFLNVDGNLKKIVTTDV